MRVFIHREVASYNENGSIRNQYGDIQLTFMENNFIDVLINRLHDCGNGIQAFMLIKYPNGVDLYDIAKKILDTIFGDLCLDVTPYKDFIINWDLSKESHNGWNIDTEIETNSGGDVWLPFTRENVAKYITIEKLKTDDYIDEVIIIRGEIDSSCNFTYDFPIIGSNETMEVYEKSRGNLNYYYDISSDKESDDEEDI
jgi:hypothetical protein